MFAEDHKVGCNGYRGRLKIIRTLWGPQECCDDYMGCLITTSLAVIAVGVGFGLYRKQG